MQNTCYIVMPYGGDDPAKQKFFEGVYRSIIMAAAREAGFADEEIIREDHKGEAGTILRNIVNHIASSRIVIADLTGGNANVYYELGISHSFHKSSTILIAEKGSTIPFDVQGLNIIQYSTDISAMAESVERLKKTILQRLSGSASADNSLHEFIPMLPRHLMELLSEEGDEVQKQMEALSTENRRLTQLIQRSGLDLDDSAPVLSVREILESAKERLKYAGDAVLSQLREYVEKEDYESFLDFLTNVFELGSPTLTELSSIIELAESCNNRILTEAVLSASNQLYPDDAQIMTKLAKAYAGQPAGRVKALKIVNSALGLELDEEGEPCGVDLSRLTHNNLARFLDTYLNISAYDELISAARFLMTHGAEVEAPMLRRNIFIAMVRSGRLDDARELLPELEAANEDTNYYYIGVFYSKLGDYISQYRYLEKAMAADPEDLDYPYMLSAICLDENIARVSDEEVRKVPREDARRSAAAFLFYSVEQAASAGDNSKLQQVLRIIQRSRNGLTHLMDPILQYVKNGQELDYSITNPLALNYCLKLIEENK